MKKRQIKKYMINKIVISVAILFALWALTGIYMVHHKSPEDKLKDIGYSIEEIAQLKTHLNSNSLAILTEYQYNEKIIEIVRGKDFNEKNLKQYLDFLNKFNTAKVSDIIFLVNNRKNDIAYSPDISNIINHEDFRLEDLDRYLSYYEKYELEANLIILAVYYDLDKEDMELDDISALFLGKDYYLQRNLIRYKNYYNKNQTLSPNEIIIRVNSNIDKVFYQDINSADLSKNTLVLVNKFYYLDNNYVPNKLVDIGSTYGTGKLQEEAYEAYLRMYNDAKKENLNLYIVSAYRSYERQNILYTGYVSSDGQKNADTYSARAGYSEHQTGLAIDLGTFTNRNLNNFSKTKEFIWTKNNAHKYGFIIRYPSGKEYITGYMYEPWHIRFVGIEAATYIYEHNITFDEYFEYFVK